MTDAAFHCEAKKHGFRQTQDGVVVSFVLHPQEVPAALTLASLGTRYMLVFAEIGDDEKPKQHEAPHVAPRSDETSASDAAQQRDKPRRKFDEMPRSQQAGMLCNDPDFQAYFSAANEREARSTICGFFDVSSRADLDDETHAFKWRNLITRFRAWQQEREFIERTGT